MKNQEIAHDFAHATETGHGDGSNYFYHGNTIYSFGTHFIIARKVRDKQKNVLFVLFNENNYSNCTSCHQSTTKNALCQKVYLVTTEINNFNALNEIKAQELKMFKLADKYSIARAEHVKNGYLHDILFCVETIEFFADFYKVKSKVPKRIKQYYDLTDSTILGVLGVSAKNQEKALKSANTRAENQLIIENSKKAEQENINISKWKQHENPIPIIEEKELKTNQYHELRNKIFEDLVANGVTTDEDDNFKAFDDVLGNSLNVNWEDDGKQNTYNRDEILKICNNMSKYGGSFIKNLSEAIHKADVDNLKILINGFDKYFIQYLNL